MCSSNASVVHLNVYETELVIFGNAISELIVFLQANYIYMPPGDKTQRHMARPNLIAGAGCLNPVYFSAWGDAIPGSQLLSKDDNWRCSEII